MNQITLKTLGYNETLEQYRIDHKLESYQIGRVSTEHKDRYNVKTIEGDYESELIGNLRFNASNKYELPAVGDWVAIMVYDIGKAIIHSIFPRSSIIERQAIGNSAQIQIIATNVDYGLILQAIDRDFSINRLERYLTICNTANVIPIIILSKIDLISNTELESKLAQIRTRINNIPIITVNNQTENGYKELISIIQSSKTYCLLGSSGVGKSTLLNHLAGKILMSTGEIGKSANRGKHITSHRSLVLMDNGSIFIDNPGMRTIGISDQKDGLESTFQIIINFSSKCKYKDCTHIQENGCAVQKAIENGTIDQSSYDNYQKLEKEKRHFELSIFERKQKDKSFGKMIKNIQKQRKKEKILNLS